MKIKRLSYGIAIILITIFAQIYFYPFEREFKISAGVIVFALAILIIEDSKEWLIGIYAGFSIFITRVWIACIATDIAIIRAVEQNYTALIYYIGFGLILKMIHMKRIKDNPILMLLSLWGTDVLCNLIESAMIGELNKNLVMTMIIIGFIRSFTVSIIYWSYKQQQLYKQELEHHKRYVTLNTVMANVQAEVFYLEKSIQDIERIMKKSYDIYDEYKDQKELGEKTLDLAREIHEIKKDYYRIYSGLEQIVKNVQKEETMNLSTVVNIIKSNTVRYINQKNLDVLLEFKWNEEVNIKNYYSIFAIINNLVINSIEAIHGKGEIQVCIHHEIGTIYIQVEDNGIGIPQDIMPYIFNPGFTTKYDQQGKASTGIGLYHIKTIIEKQKGEISIKSQPHVQTISSVHMPI